MYPRFDNLRKSCYNYTTKYSAIKIIFFGMGNCLYYDVKWIKNYNMN